MIVISQDGKKIIEFGRSYVLLEIVTDSATGKASIEAHGNAGLDIQKVTMGDYPDERSAKKALKQLSSSMEYNNKDAYVLS